MPNRCRMAFPPFQIEIEANEWIRYKHGIISNLINPTLLRNVREEIQEHLHFSPKETDIYKIHQSGDLANLDGLDDSSLSRLPSLLRLRDALYSPSFREYISHVANAGPVSGKKTDMAINVYTPTCHLLCHDDVIGSRRISYILYLTDPDLPWQKEWGGALRLYPTETMKTEEGTDMVVPSADFSLSIPPAFNQLSFFAIQPGRSFHDVEEVYVSKDKPNAKDGERVRMAISGWFHIPQEGEEGYEQGMEEKLAERSSLNQLQQSKADVFDLPKSQWRDVEWTPQRDEGEAPFTDYELDWLLRFINPTYLTPDTAEALLDSFEENSAVTLSDFLHPEYAERLRKYIEPLDRTISSSLPSLTGAIQNTGIARPPHKHRYMYRQPTLNALEQNFDSPLDQLLEHLLPSSLFARWLSLVTGLSFTRAEFLARRFRRGMDYTLATSYDKPQPQLELCLGITPTLGWGEDEVEDSESESEIPARDNPNNTKGKPTVNRNGDDSIHRARTTGADPESFGGYEMYMAGDEDEADGGSDDGVTIPAGAASQTGAGQRRRAKADPAIYNSNADDEDDGVLFSNPAGWNKLTLVLRDTGVMKFVKYVSECAPGDRWDVVASFSVEDEED
jgi:Rps23 Pro-64 3,4-dihydroxylase Tpa1-like proline 4-hydroxylase